MDKMSTPTLEYCIAKYFNPRVNLIVPNVHWGFGLNYEIDLLVVSQSGYATEIELKVSKADIKKDLTKSKYAHKSNKIKKFTYAVPEYLKDCEYLPENCGLLSVDDRGKVKCIRPPVVNKLATKMSEKDIFELQRLCCMRVWSLKKNLFDYKKHVSLKTSKGDQ